MSNWQEIPETKIPAGLIWKQQPQDGGQIIDVQYGSFDRGGASSRLDPYKRVHETNIGPKAVRYYKRVEVACGVMARYQVLVIGQVVFESRSREAAQREADRLNREAEEELGYDLVGDGAASVVEVA